MNFSHVFFSKKDSYEHQKQNISLDALRQLALDQKDDSRFLSALIPFSGEPYKVIGEWFYDEAKNEINDCSQEHKVRPAAACLLSHALMNDEIDSYISSLPVIWDGKNQQIDEDILYHLRLKGFAGCVLYLENIKIHELQFLIEILKELKMDPFLKIKSLEELELAFSSDAKIIGIDLNQVWDKNLHHFMVRYGRGRLFVAMRECLSFEQMDVDRRKGFHAFLKTAISSKSF